MTAPAYSVEREYPHAVDRLWHAWSDAAALEAWYHPVQLANVPGSVASEAEVGGWWTVAIDVTERGFAACFYGRYTRVEPMTRLEHTMHYTQSTEEVARDESTPSHRVVVDFEERGASTWVRFSQFGNLPEGQAEQAKAGMESYFDSLAAFLATSG